MAKLLICSVGHLYGHQIPQLLGSAGKTTGSIPATSTIPLFQTILLLPMFFGGIIGGTLFKKGVQI